MRDQPGVFRLGQACKHNGELVSAQAADDIRAAHAFLQALSDLNEQLIAGGVSEGVVDVFEPVEVDVHATDRPAVLRGLRQHLNEAVVQHVTVRQSRERVVLREIGEPVLGALALGEIAGDLAEAAQRPRVVAQRGDDDVGPETRPVLAQAPAFVFEASLG